MSPCPSGDASDLAQDVSDLAQGASVLAQIRLYACNLEHCRLACISSSHPPQVNLGEQLQPRRLDWCYAYAGWAEYYEATLGSTRGHYRTSLSSIDGPLVVSNRAAMMPDAKAISRGPSPRA
jgi:hypothetical protein